MRARVWLEQLVGCAVEFLDRMGLGLGLELDFGCMSSVDMIFKYVCVCVRYKNVDIISSTGGLLLYCVGVYGAADTQAGGRGPRPARRQPSGPAESITRRRPASNGRRPTDAAQQPLGGTASQRHGPTGQVLARRPH